MKRKSRHISISKHIEYSRLLNEIVLSDMYEIMRNAFPMDRCTKKIYKMCGLASEIKSELEDRLFNEHYELSDILDEQPSPISATHVYYGSREHRTKTLEYLEYLIKEQNK